MNEEYTCDNCNGIFLKARSDEDALAEKETLWGNIPLDQCAIICDDCFSKIMVAN